MKLFTALCLCLLAIGCGGSKGNAPINPTNSVNNGQTLATVTSYWACESCIPGYLIGIEFAVDGQFQTIITDSGPGSSTCVGTLSQEGEGGYLLLGGSCSGGTAEIEEITSLVGSISSGAMTVTMTASMDPSVSYSNCAFTLVEGPQP